MPRGRGPSPRGSLSPPHDVTLLLKWRHRQREAHHLPGAGTPARLQDSLSPSPPWIKPHGLGRRINLYRPLWLSLPSHTSACCGHKVGSRESMQGTPEGTGPPAVSDSPSFLASVQSGWFPPPSPGHGHHVCKFGRAGHRCGHPILLPRVCSINSFESRLPQVKAPSALSGRGRNIRTDVGGERRELPEGLPRVTGARTGVRGRARQGDRKGPG